ncbi:ferric reductase-like transmembrane domain-containing protein [Candidatus Daviesbacteria bacterium]|nr:ferric reductase-like transmembrane domain-containing protein [Candidatus Daviesbacteria bacterium]
MDEPRSVGWKKTTTIVLIVFCFSLLYSFIRYNLVRNVPLDNLPLFISNKSVALSATILIGLSFLLGPLARFWPKTFSPHLYLRKHLGVIGFAIAALHVVMSLVLLNPAYYSKLYAEGGKLNLNGEASILFGILSFLIFSAISITSLPPIEKHMLPGQWKFVQRIGYLAYLFVLLHVTIMGYQGWFRADSWQYGLASISLISAIFVLFVLIMRFLVIAFSLRK